MYEFRASRPQLAKLFKLAFDASEPVGYGRLHYDPKQQFPADPDDKFFSQDWLSADYVGGRMVKLIVQRCDESDADKYRIVRDFEPDVEWQSWAKTYPSWASLLKAAGITEIIIMEEKKC